MKKYFFRFFIISVFVASICIGNAAAQLEPVKGEGAEANAENAFISQINAAAKAENWLDMKKFSTQLIAMNPSRWEYQKALGDAETHLGKYQMALVVYEKTIDTIRKNAGNDFNNAEAKIKAAVSEIFLQEGNNYLKLQKYVEAIDAYTKAANLSDNPGKAYFNICATQYNTGDMDGAVKSCDKAIQFDPNKADAWFIKGSAMFGKGELDRSGKYMPPAGTADSLKKYLELEPNGAHATDVKEMLWTIEAK